MSVSEQELQEKAKGKRITAQDLDNNISAVYTYNVGKVLAQTNDIPVSEHLYLLTMCVIVLNNGYTVTGQSACADPSNYNEDIGNRLAFEDAKKKIWALMGYHLKQEIYLNNDGSFVGRMEREANELGDKLGKLDLFIEGITFQELPDQEKERLTAQRKAMAEYHQILKQRLAIHKL